MKRRGSHVRVVRISTPEFRAGLLMSRVLRQTFFQSAVGSWACRNLSLPHMARHWPRFDNFSASNKVIL